MRPFGDQTGKLRQSHRPQLQPVAPPMTHDSPTPAAEIPAVCDRMRVHLLPPPHPAVLTDEDLLVNCELRTQRRSGPGGQHRNKTSSGVFLSYATLGIVAEATERRSQAANRRVALTRLRYALALAVRTRSPLDGEQPVDERETELRARLYGKSLRLSDRNDAKPGVLAMLLNDLHAAGGQPSLVAPRWATTSSGMVRLLKSHHPAFELVNRIRMHHGRRPLK